MACYPGRLSISIICRAAIRSIEGEALAVAWGLEQTKYFTQGCDNLVVVTDHKPLVKVLGDRTLDEISNTRLFRLKQRTLPWRYEIIRMPGKTNNAADATSRHPSCQNYEYVEFASNNLLSDEDNLENIMAASISRDASANFSLSWEDLASETSTNATLRLLMNTIKNGFPTDRQMIDEKLHPFWPLREAHTCSRGRDNLQRQSCYPTIVTESST